jgi:hypothetical protein
MRDNEAMPKSWSDWVALVGAIVGSVAGIGGLSLSVRTLRRDRAELQLTLHRYPQTYYKIATTYAPNAVFQGGTPENKIANWILFTVFNRGIRPIHIEKIEMNYVQPRGPGSMHHIADFDQLLTEERRRVSFVFDEHLGDQHSLFSVSIVDDLHSRHVVFAAEWPWRRRFAWYIKRALHLRRERKLLRPPSSPQAG